VRHGRGPALLAGALALLSISCAAAPIRASPAGNFAAQLEALEQRAGGRIGFYALEVRSGAVLARRADEHFPLCSTFKWLLVADVLSLSEASGAPFSLETQLAYGPADLAGHAPVARANLRGDARQASMSVGALCDAAVEQSDNTAANLLLPLVGGPAGLTSWLRSLGDSSTRLDRSEPELNSNLPGDPRDTSTPRAMAATMRTLLAADALSAEARERLLAAMERSETGLHRLRAGFPAGWRAADKTGTCGERGAVNDLAVLWPPGRGPIVIASFLSDSAAGLELLEEVQRALGRLVVDALARPRQGPDDSQTAPRPPR